jgi:hypothetical protein
VQVAGAVAAGLCVWAFAAATDTASWLYQGGFLGFAIATAVVITAIIQPSRSPLIAVLSLRPVRWIGQVSYGLYLWHWPVQIAISEPRTGITGWELALLRVAATFTFTTLSYYLIERPIRFGALKGWTARLAAPVCAALVAVAIIVATAGATPPPDFATNAGDQVTIGPPPTTKPTTAVDGTPPSTPTRFVLIGDSLAHSLGDGLQTEAARRGITVYGVTRSGCGLVSAVPSNASGQVTLPWAQGCADGAAQYENDLVAKYQPQVVLWLSSWEAGDHLFSGVYQKFGTPAGDVAMLREFEAARQRLTADGAVLVMLTVPGIAVNSDRRVGGDPALDKAFRHLTKLMRTFAAQHPDSVRVADLARIVCPSGSPCPEFVDGVRLRPTDGAHYTGAGPAWVAPRLLDAVTKALSASTIP